MSILRLAAALCFPLLAAFSVAQSPLEKKLNEPVSSYTLQAENGEAALAQIAARFQIPMGIQWKAALGGAAKWERPVAATYTNTTVKRILISLVGNLGYESTIANEVFHVFPPGANKDPLSFLNIKLGRVELATESVELANRRIKEMARQRFAASDNPENRSGSASSVVRGLGEGPVKFRLENATVRDLLDKLVTSAGFKIWIVTYPEQRQLTRSGFLKAQSIYNPDVPDEYQPVWDLLVWGQDPVSKSYRPEWLSSGT